MIGSGYIEEDSIGKVYDVKLLRKLLKYAKPYRWFIIVAIVLNIFSSAFGPLRPYLTQIAIDKGALKNNIKVVGVVALVFIAALAVQSIINYYVSYYTQYVGQKIIFDIRKNLFSHLLSLSARFFDKNPVGRLVTRTTNDVESLNEMFSSGIVMIFSDIFLIVWILVFMFYMNAKLAITALLTMPFLVVAVMIFRKKARDSFREVRSKLAKLNSYLQEKLNGIKTIIIYNKEDFELNSFKKINQEYTNANLKSIFYYAVFYPVVELISSVAVALIIWEGSSSYLRGEITFGEIAAFIQFVEMFFRPIRDLSEKYNILQTAFASSERIFKLLDIKEEKSAPVIPKKLENIKGTIEFKNVWFAYNDEDYVLKDVSFKVEAGETAAIVGHTGAGKTSIINLILKFYEYQKGDILIDGISVKDLEQEEIRKRVGFVSQDSSIFKGSLLFNLTLENENISLEKIEETIRIDGIKEFIEKLPSGLNYEIKEKGTNLSHGQKQLAAIARVLIRDPKIIILDEATANIDSETEKLLQKAFKKLFVNRTSLVIAHRLSTIYNSDKIIVMNKGSVADIGDHETLLNKKGIYYKLYKLQFYNQIKTNI